MSKRLVVALSGGVGGAKLALGLSRVLPADELLVVANTGDDFEHLGLSISPDIDTLTYVLAGIDNPATGWGRRDQTREGPCHTLSSQEISCFFFCFLLFICTSFARFLFGFLLGRFFFIGLFSDFWSLFFGGL